MKRLFVVFLIVCLLTAASTVSVFAEKESGSNLVTTITTEGQYSIFLTVAAAVGIGDKLNGDGPFTIFLANDQEMTAWFAEQGYKTLDDVKADSKVPGIFLSHIAPGKYMASDLKDGMKIKTLAGNEVGVKVDGSDIYINNAKITMSDYVTTNGVIQVIDKVIDPTKVPAETKTETKTETSTTTAPAANPKTGDTSLFIYFVGAAVSAGGIFAARKKISK